MMVPIGHYLFLSLALLVIGIVGVVTRRNVIIILMSVELILNAVNINLVAFSRLVGSVEGQIFRHLSSLPMRRPRLRWAWASSSRSSAIARRFWRTKWTS
jgi:multisubunit Na+/H+ antiporter MnhC subunit